MNISSNVQVEWWSTVSKDRFTRGQYGMLYAKPKVRLSRAGNNDYSLKLSCDCVVSFVSQVVIEELKEK